MLFKNYQDLNKINDLINLGNISSLDKEITAPEGHSFDNQIDGYTVAYGRDRGEEITIKEAKDEFDYIQLALDMNMEYLYLYSYGKWWICEVNKERTFVELEERL